ncbi:hypothetical protein MKW92_021212 [Papaver armeniacum]|nr:hypothetical protein MKW92_021212 [Papaver armeniacum]
MAAALSWCCGVIDCSLLQPGSPCFEPDSLAAHAAFAFNLYYQKNNRMKGSCDFNGTAMVTTTDPNHDISIFVYHNPEYTKSSASWSSTVLFYLLCYLWGGVLGGI